MKRFIFILIFLFATEIYSDNTDNLNYETESKNNFKKHSFELFLRLNRASWVPESIRRTSDANSSLGNSANNGIFTSYDPPSRDKKFENPDFKSFGFVYKNSVHKFSFDYNYLSLSQHFKVISNMQEFMVRQAKNILILVPDFYITSTLFERKINSHLLKKFLTRIVFY